jgi:hypothetical protein
MGALVDQKIINAPRERFQKCETTQAQEIR